MTEALVISQYERLLAKLSHKAVSRAQSRGLSVEFEDYFQESCATFLIAKEKFDPTIGVKFSTYLWQSVRNNLKRFEDVVWNTQGGSVSLDAEIGDEAGTLHDVLAADLETVEDRIIRLETESEIFSGLSPETKRAVAILNEPPMELVKEMRRMEAFRLNCKANGYAAATRTLNIHLVCTALNYSPAQVKRVKLEIKDVMEKHGG